MKARFVGDPNDGGAGPNTVTVFGVEFVKDKWQTVEDPRFARHSHFETKDDAPAKGSKFAPASEAGD